MREKGLALLLVVVLAAGSLLPVNAMEVKGEVPGNDIGQETGLPDEEEKDSEESDPSEATEAEEEQVPDLGNVEETEETDKKDESSLEQEETQTEEESGESSEEATGDTGDTDISGSESEDAVLSGWKIDQTQVTLQPGESTYFTVLDVNEEDGKPEISINNASGITVSEITGEATEDISVPAGISFRYEVTAALPGDYVISVKVQDSIKEISVHVEEQELLEEGVSKAEGIKPSVPAPTNNTAIEEDIKAAEPGWSEDGLYYTNENGELSKGITEIDGVLYYFDENTGELCQEGKWITKDENRYFCNAEGVLYQNQFIKFGTTYYYMGSDGSVQKGLVTAKDGKTYYANPENGIITKSSWVKADGKEYFADSTGALYQDQFIKFGTTYYYMGSDGSVQKGFVTAKDGKTYYANPENGIITKSSWVKADGKEYFADSTGALYQDQFIKFGTTYYYMGSDGSVQKGFVTVKDGKTYYANPESGIITKSSWVKADGKEYFADSTGALYQDQFIKFGTTYYYMGSDGSVQKGLVTAKDGKTYYANPESGIITKSSWVKADGKEYFADSTGALYQDQFIKFGTTYYYMGSDGSVQKGFVTAKDGKTYYANPENGIITKSSWVKADGKEYFADSTGALYQDQFIKFGTTYYYMGSDGSVQKGVVKAADGQYYYTDPDEGILQKEAGWLDVDGKRYFADGTGKLYSNQFIKFGDIYYYMGADASMQKGVVKAADGQYYYTDPDEGILQKEAGWLDVDGKRYFADGTGKLYSNQFIKFGDIYYYMGADASIQKGVVKAADGQYYYTDPDEGILQKEVGWLDVEGKRYFADGTGKLYSNQFIKFGDIYYYMGADASMQKGVVKAADGQYYYTNPDEGILQKEVGWLDVEGKRYFADGTGKLYSNQFIKFGDIYYYMGADASMQKGIVKAADGYYYNLNKETGVLIKQAGWLHEGEKDYFSDANGKLYSNQFIKFGDIYYYCGSDAAIVKDQTYPVNGVLYKFDKKGVMIKEGGWGSYNGNKYYKNPATGFPYTGWVTFGTTWYYANSNGFMVKGWQYINGKYYYFYPDTYIMARNTVIDGYVIGGDGARVPTALSKMQQKAAGYSSSTSYLLMVDRAAHKVGVFRGSKGNWTNIYFWDCTNGAPSTPTVSGVFTVGIKGYYFDSGASRCFWYTQFYGNYLFHTVLCNKDGSIRDGRLGMALSHGCVRLSIANAKWIYDNIPRGTKVVVY